MIIKFKKYIKIKPRFNRPKHNLFFDLNFNSKIKIIVIIIDEKIFNNCRFVTNISSGPFKKNIS